MLRLFPILLCALSLVAFTACESPSYVYQYIPGKTATLRDGYAIPPEGAPQPVVAAIEAGNRIAGLPYRYGGGHHTWLDTGYDCSGSASFVLREAGLMQGVRVSKEFRSYGRSGEGEWINIYARRGHVFLSVAGVRFDTGWNDGHEGPQWTTRDRPAPGCVVRHPAGL